MQNMKHFTTMQASLFTFRQAEMRGNRLRTRGVDIIAIFKLQSFLFPFLIPEKFSKSSRSTEYPPSPPPHSFGRNLFLRVPVLEIRQDEHFNNFRPPRAGHSGTHLISRYGYRAPRLHKKRSLAPDTKATEELLAIDLSFPKWGENACAV